jgi:hypothetical protein
MQHPNMPTVHQTCEVCRKRYNAEMAFTAVSTRHPLSRNLLGDHCLCPTHAALFLEGYVALVEVLPETTKMPFGEVAATSRTGKIVHVSRQNFCRYIGVPDTRSGPVALVPPGVIERLLNMLG